MRKERIKEAKEIFGEEIVQEVLEIVHLSDPDGAHSLFEDFEKFEHAECVEFMFFDEDE